MLATLLDRHFRAERRRGRTFTHDVSGAVHLMTWDRTREKGLDNFLEARKKYMGRM